jgi:hypothetical protein
MREVVPVGSMIVMRQAMPAAMMVSERGHLRPSFSRNRMLSPIDGSSTAPKTLTTLYHPNDRVSTK